MRCLGAGFAALALTFSAQAQTGGKPIKVGVLTDMTANFADSVGPGAVFAARMAVADMGGSVLGRPIEVVYADHQNKADIGAQIVRNWYDNGGVGSIHEVINSSVALAVQEITKNKNKIAVYSGASSAELTGKQCSPNGMQWAYDSYSLTRGMVPLVQQGVKSWYSVTVDYAAGHATEAAALAALKGAGGTSVGVTRFPLGNSDFSTFIFNAQASKSQGISVAAGGNDAVNFVKQSAEFGVDKGGQKTMIFGFGLTDVHALGLETAKGILFTQAVYWDQDEASRTWSKRFMAEIKRMPTDLQGSVYSSVLHYLKSVQKAGTDETGPVLKAMRETPVEDFMTHGARIREDGRLMREIEVVQVKSPAESKYAWDYLKIVATMPGEVAFRPIAESECPLVKKN